MLNQPWIPLIRWKELTGANRIIFKYRYMSMGEK